MSAARDASRLEPVGLLAGVSLVLFMVRLYAANHISFGDSEALYACWAMHPQPAYLDHPGLIALILRAIGRGSAPSPQIVHAYTAAISTLVPWLVVLAARANGASPRAAGWAGLTVALVPEAAVGLFGMTPDLPLAVLWLLTLAFAGLGLESPPHSMRAAYGFVVAGLFAGVACTAKLSAFTLVLALLATYIAKPARPHARTLWPWAGLLFGMIPVVPIVIYEAHTGWPMLHHRMVDTQGAAGVSIRDAGAILLGQLVYVSPGLAVVGFAFAWGWLKNWRTHSSPHDVLLRWAFVIPVAALLLWCLRSGVAEPHGLAPALVALPIAYACAKDRPKITASRPIVACSLALALVMSAAAYAWVLVPQAMRLWPASAPVRANLAAELFGWPDVARSVRRAVLLARVRGEGEKDVVVVGPDWTVCAQMHALLGPDIAVGCMTPMPDDFDTWFPRSAWAKASTIVFVSDNRFTDEASSLFPSRTASERMHITTTRGGRILRTFTIDVLELRALGAI